LTPGAVLDVNLLTVTIYGATALSVVVDLSRRDNTEEDDENEARRVHIRVRRRTPKS